jgi:hypothetical protein
MLAATARQRLDNLTPELMVEVYRLFDLQVQETPAGLQVHGVIPIPDDGSDIPLAAAVGGDVRAEAPRNPLPDFTGTRTLVRVPFRLTGRA